MDPTIATLQAVHRELIQRLQDGDEHLRAVMESVPQMYGLVQRYCPEADAVIMSREELRDLVTSVVVDVLQTQAQRSCAQHAIRTIR